MWRYRSVFLIYLYSATAAAGGESRAGTPRGTALSQSRRPVGIVPGRVPGTSLPGGGLGTPQLPGASPAAPGQLRWDHGRAPAGNAGSHRLTRCPGEASLTFCGRASPSSGAAVGGRAVGAGGREQRCCPRRAPQGGWGCLREGCCGALLRAGKRSSVERRWRRLVGSWRECHAWFSLSMAFFFIFPFLPCASVYLALKQRLNLTSFCEPRGVVGVGCPGRVGAGPLLRWGSSPLLPRLRARWVPNVLLRSRLCGLTPPFLPRSPVPPRCPLGLGAFPGVCGGIVPPVPPPAHRRRSLCGRRCPCDPKS